MYTLKQQIWRKEQGAVEDYLDKICYIVLSITALWDVTPCRLNQPLKSRQQVPP
jgi:hypothetical protein